MRINCTVRLCCPFFLSYYWMFRMLHNCYARQDVPLRKRMPHPSWLNCPYRSPFPLLPESEHPNDNLPIVVPSMFELLVPRDLDPGFSRDSFPSRVSCASGSEKSFSLVDCRCSWGPFETWIVAVVHHLRLALRLTNRPRERLP